MDLLGVRSTGTALLGRERERAEIDRLLERAAEGESQTLVVRGEAGIGKTALLEYAADRAAAMTVLRATGVEAESNLAFAGLYGLVRPILSRLEGVPEMQAAALAGALGLAPSTGSDRFLVSAAVLGLLAAAAEEQPLLCLVDDAQWLDRPSAEALVFAARRLGADRVAMIFGARDGDAQRFDAPGLPELTVSGLDPSAAAAVLAARGREATPAVRARLLEQAHGNPLALMELPAGLTDAQLAGEAPLPGTIPLTPRLHALFRERVERLPEATVTALLIAAAEGTGDLPTVQRAAAELNLDPYALDPAERAGLIATAGGIVSFRHPLVRSALYQGATGSSRQRVHRALADALSGEENADRRVWHEAYATLTADEEVASALEASARRSQLRAGHAAAGSAYERAAELSVEPAAQVRRLTAAASAIWEAGQRERALMLISRAEPSAEGELLVPLLHLHGVIDARSGNLAEAVNRFSEAAKTATDPSLTLELLLEAAEAASFSGDLRKVAELGEWAAQIAPQTRRDHFIVATLRGFACAFAGDYRESRRQFADALGLASALGDPRALIWASNAAAVSGSLGDGLPYSTQAVELARRQGLLSVLPLALEQHAMVLIALSRFDLAYVVAEEGYRLAQEVGQGTGWHLANMATVEWVWGREQDARAHAEQVRAIGERSGKTFLRSVAEWTLGMIELTGGRPDEAAEHLLLVTGARGWEHPVVSVSAVPDAVEAAARAGRAAEAAAPLERFRAMVTLAPTDGNRALLARSDALLELRSPEDAFSDALALADALPPFQRARTELLYGEWLRRERRRQDARVHLRHAADAFRSLGAAPWAERAEAELRATGETARKRDPSTLDDLTPQERQIAGLVADGLTNREVAAQLFLSPRTIDYHLRKVFSKLGIASRSELVRDGLPSRA